MVILRLSAREVLDPFVPISTAFTQPYTKKGLGTSLRLTFCIALKHPHSYLPPFSHSIPTLIQLSMHRTVTWSTLHWPEHFLKSIEYYHRVTNFCRFINGSLNEREGWARRRISTLRIWARKHHTERPMQHWPLGPVNILTKWNNFCNSLDPSKGVGQGPLKNSLSFGYNIVAISVC